MAVNHHPTVVISSRFLVQYPVHLAVATKFWTIGENEFIVKDVNGTIIFQMKSKRISLRDRRKLLDSDGNVLVSLRHKLMTAHGRWVAYRGDNMDDDKYLLFTVRRSSVVQMSTKLDVFLAGNEKEEVPDFKIRGGFSDGSFVIYLGNTNNIIAQMCREGSSRVIINPNVDYAFVVSLVVIVEKINGDGNIKESMSSPAVEACVQGMSSLAVEAGVQGISSLLFN